MVIHVVEEIGACGGGGRKTKGHDFIGVTVFLRKVIRFLSKKRDLASQIYYFEAK